MEIIEKESNITFVCCVESGPLETQTIRMIESLRRWGGRLANAPVIAVTPRFGSPVSKKTYQAFRKLNVKYLRFWASTSYSWNKFLNKPYALLAAEEYATTECIGWLDSDILIIDEPEQLILPENEDFRACTPDSSGGTTGVEDPNDAYWQKVCQALGVDIESLPWVTTAREGKRIRAYFNSGVFVYRRSTNFANHYLQSCLELLNSRTASLQTGVFYIDQIVLGLTMVKLSLRWQSLSHSHNYNMGMKSYYQWDYDEDELRGVKILHYHDAMWPKFWDTFIQCLYNTHSEVARWLVSLGHLQNEAPLQWRLVNRILNGWRLYKKQTYEETCQVL